MTDEEKIRQVMAKYQAAYEALNIEAVKEVQPALASFQIDRISRAFTDYRSLKLKFNNEKLSITGPNATIKCVVGQIATYKNGQIGATNLPTMFSFRKMNDNWVMTRTTETPGR